MTAKLLPLSKMTEQETIERLSVSIRDASEIARKLAKAQKKQKWVQVAHILSQISQKAEMLATARSLPRSETLFLIGQEQKKLDKQKIVMN